MKFLQNFRSICLKLAHSKCRGEKDSLVNMDLGGHIFLNFLKIEYSLGVSQNPSYFLFAKFPLLLHTVLHSKFLILLWSSSAVRLAVLMYLDRSKRQWQFASRLSCYQLFLVCKNVKYHKILVSDIWSKIIKLAFVKLRFYFHHLVSLLLLHTLHWFIVVS